MRILIAFIFAALCHGQALFRLQNVTTGAAAYSGAGDVVTTNWLGYWSLQAFSAAKRGTKVANVCDAADAHCADMLTDATTGNPIVPSLNPNCSVSGNCTVKTLYDNTGALACTGGIACDLTQATIASRPTLSINCVGTLPCMTFTATQSLTGPNLGAAYSQPLSVSVVGERTGNFTSFGDLGGVSGGNIQIGFVNSANTAFSYAGTVGTAAATDSAYHAIQSLVNGASSTIYIDGSSTALSIGANGILVTTPFCIGSSCGNGLTGNSFEFGAFSVDKSANFSALNSNQHTRIGF